MSFNLGHGVAIRETPKGLLVVLDSDGEEHWLAKSQIHENSEVYKKGTDGDVIVTEWWAKQAGFL